MPKKISKTKSVKPKTSSVSAGKTKKTAPKIVSKKTTKKTIKSVSVKPEKKVIRPAKKILTKTEKTIAEPIKEEIKTEKKTKSAEISVRLLTPQVVVPKTEKEIVEEEIGKDDALVTGEIATINEPKNIISMGEGQDYHSQPDNYNYHNYSSDDKLVEEISEREMVHDDFESDMPITRPASLGLYRKIAYGFIFFTVVLLATIFYLSFVKVSITITPKQERISDNLLVDIYGGDTDVAATSGAVKGVVTTTEIEQTKNYPATGVEIIGEEAVGKAFIINNYNKSQSLVATTRLLTGDNKLFRIKNTVNVPAGKSVEVEIYADDPGPSMAIGPTKFKIPGLWAGLQDKIYAESKESVEYRQKTKKYVTQTDINNSVENLRADLLVKAKNDVEGDYKDYDHLVYDIDNNSVDVEVGAKVNEEKDEFSVTIKTSVAVIAFNDDQIFNMAKEKLSSRISDDKELSGFSKSNIVYNLDNYNLERKTATVNASFEGLMSYKSDSSIIDKSMLPGLDRAQLMEFLDSKTELEDYEVKFYPSFINKVPNLVDRIEVNIKKSSLNIGE